MLTSPFQPPSQRQTILAGQLNAAHAADDQKRLLLLRSQWVHRFGVDTLPEFSRFDPVDELQEVTAPPLSTPRSLRRWLVSDDDSVPKAS